MATWSACVVEAGDDAGDTSAASQADGASAASQTDGTSQTGGSSQTGATSQGGDGSTATDTASSATDPTAADTSAGSDGTAEGPASTGGGETGGGVIDVELDGCAVDFGGTVVVSYNGSLGVASVYDSSNLTGSFQFDMLAVGDIELSSQHRVDTGMVVNMVDTASTWTNLDADALAGGIDTIGGVLGVVQYEPAQGLAELTFTDVTLRNVVDGGVCTINGSIETTMLFP